MALRDQPYLPLYVQDFLTDEKLSECSAESTGVYIRLMCIMHKTQPYGTIILKERDKSMDSPVENFALKLTKHMPYDFGTIARAITELAAEGVITIDGDALYQKRMVRDSQLSDKRSNSGKKGAEKTNHQRKKPPEPETPAPGTDPEFGKVMTYFMENINDQPSAIAIEGLREYTKTLGAEVVIHACSLAQDNQTRRWTYIRGILIDYTKNGLTTMSAILEDEKRHQQRKEAKRGGAGKDYAAGGFTPSTGFKG